MVRVKSRKEFTARTLSTDEAEAYFSRLRFKAKGDTMTDIEMLTLERIKIRAMVIQMGAEAMHTANLLREMRNQPLQFEAPAFIQASQHLEQCQKEIESMITAVAKRMGE